MADMLAPGPWLAHAARDARPDGSRFFTITDRDGRTIAVVSGGQATADVLAAALDLLAACRVIAKAELYDPATGIIDADVLEVCQEEARDALRKATGEGA